MSRSHRSRVLGCILLAFALASSASAQTSTPTGQVLYDNSTTGETNFFPLVLEYGDEVILKPHPPNQLWILTDFFMEYYGDFTPDGDETGRVRLYLNDGPRPNYPPKTVLFDSLEFSLQPGFQVRAFNGLNITLPDDGDWTRLTWTIQFDGLRGVMGDQAGLLLRPTPSVGHSFKDLWINRETGWTLFQIAPPNPNSPPHPVTNPDPIENFGARIVGVPTGSAAPPQLKLSRQAENLVLEWTGAARLQVSDTVNGAYADVIGAASPYSVKPEDAPVKFWRLATGAAPPVPGLNIQRSEDRVILQWTGSARLQVSDSVGGGYVDVNGASSPHSVSLESAAGTTMKFWRLVN